MKKLLQLLILALAPLFGACSTHSNESVPIAAKNESRDSIDISISIGGVTNTLPVAPNATNSFVIEIPVARQPIGNRNYGPSQVDRITDIQVSVYNRDAKVSSRTQICQAGAKVTTSIVYANFPTDRGGYIMCQLLDAYGNIADPSKIDPTYSGAAVSANKGGSQ